jgi:predicted permease
VLQDIRYGWRMLARHPGFSAVATLMLAIGIGSNAAIFSAVNEVFLRSAPAVSDPERLVALGRSKTGSDFQNFGHLMFQKYQEHARAFTGLAASHGAQVLLRRDSDTIAIQANLVTGNYFSVLGVPIAAGRGFVPEDDQTPGARPVAIVSHRLWTTQFAADPALINRQIRLNDTDFTVVGLAPKAFRGLELGDSTDVWLPLMMAAQARDRYLDLNGDFFTTLSVVGRLGPGASLAQAEAEMAVLAARIETPDGLTQQRRRIVLTPNVRLPDPEWRAAAVLVVGLLWAAAVGVLLIACLNLACLLLARSAARRQEVAMRAALGAGRGRIVRQLLAEGAALASLGAVAGLVGSHWIAALFRVLVDPNLDFSIDGTVLLFVATVAALAAVAFGLAPALHLTRAGLAAGLKGARAATARRSWLLKGLVGAQVALSLVLLTGAGLFARTLQKSVTVDVGFETQHLWVVRPDLELAGYSRERAQAFREQLAERIAALPGVQHVGAASALARQGNAFGGSERNVELPGPEPGSGDRRETVNFNEVSPRYFETIGVPLIRGRAFTLQDVGGAPRVGVVNDTMARTLWPGADPIGQTLRLVQFMSLSAPIEIVGVVRDSRTIVLSDRPQPELFVPEAQSGSTNLHVLVRADRAPASIGVAIARAIHDLDPTLPRLTPERLSDRIAGDMSDQRMYAALTGLFGALALLLCLIGLAGTMALTVSQRTHEIGIRLALGAQRSSVRRMVVREGLTVMAAGVAIGLLGSVAAARLIANLLYGVSPTDPLTYSAAVAVLLCAGLAACWWPVRRVARIDALSALKQE